MHNAHVRTICLVLHASAHDYQSFCCNRAQYRKFGLCDDEFLQNENFPPQLYVREARRLVGCSRLTEHSLVPVVPTGRPPLAHDAIAVGSFAIDSFPCTERLPVRSYRCLALAVGLRIYLG